jgi:hypothetical protein
LVQREINVVNPRSICVRWMMKKVRYVLGAVGIAPALGLMLPGTAVAASHTPKKTVKTVSLEHSSAVSPDTGCGGHTAAKGKSGNFNFSVWHTASTKCVGGVNAWLANDAASGLVLRTRAYSISSLGTKTKWLSKYTGGSLACRNDGEDCSIIYYQGIHQVRANPEQVCEAIVYADDHTRVLRGPECVSFG